MIYIIYVIYIMICPTCELSLPRDPYLRTRRTQLGSSRLSEMKFLSFGQCPRQVVSGVVVCGRHTDVVGISGQHGTEFGGPLVTLNLSVTSRYFLGEGELVFT